MRSGLEQARLELRALYRALDALGVGREVAPELGRVGELDADFAEALWVLQQPPGRFNLAAMRRETRASLEALGGAREKLLGLLPEATRQQVEEVTAKILAGLRAQEAYLDIPR